MQNWEFRPSACMCIDEPLKAAKERETQFHDNSNYITTIWKFVDVIRGFFIIETVDHRNFIWDRMRWCAARSWSKDSCIHYKEKTLIIDMESSVACTTILHHCCFIVMCIPYRAYKISLSLYGKYLTMNLDRDGTWQVVQVSCSFAAFGGS